MCHVSRQFHSADMTKWLGFVFIWQTQFFYSFTKEVYKYTIAGVNNYDI